MAADFRRIPPFRRSAIPPIFRQSAIFPPIRRSAKYFIFCLGWGLSVEGIYDEVYGKKNLHPKPKK